MKKNNINSHKWAQKQFISDYVKDYNYMNIKKIQSDSTNITKTLIYGTALDKDFNKINILSNIEKYINNEY